MKPFLSVEFSAKAGGCEFEEESVALHSPAELFEFIAPGGGCETIPDGVEEIRMVYLPASHPNRGNPVADLPTMFQLHHVIFTGPLAEIAQTAEQILDKAGRGELSDAFLRAIGGSGRP